MNMSIKCSCNHVGNSVPMMVWWRWNEAVNLLLSQWGRESASGCTQKGFENSQASVLESVGWWKYKGWQDKRFKNEASILEEYVINGEGSGIWGAFSRRSVSSISFFLGLSKWTHYTVLTIFFSKSNKRAWCGSLQECPLPHVMGSNTKKTKTPGTITTNSQWFALE